MIDKTVKNDLDEMKAQTAIQNAGIEPYIDEKYWYETCGSRSGQCHSDTGRCFICVADDWEPVNYRDF